VRRWAAPWLALVSCEDACLLLLRTTPQHTPTSRLGVRLRP
jgi:hypothetical protein